MVSFDPKGVKCEKEIGTMVSKSEDNAFCFFSLHFQNETELTRKCIFCVRENMLQKKTVNHMFSPHDICSIMNDLLFCFSEQCSCLYSTIASTSAAVFLNFSAIVLMMESFPISGLIEDISSYVFRISSFSFLLSPSARPSFNPSSRPS